MLHVLQHFKAEVEGLADLMPDPDAQPPLPGGPPPPPPPAALEAQRELVYTGVLPCLLAYLRSVSAAARAAEARPPETHPNPNPNPTPNPNPNPKPNPKPNPNRARLPDADPNPNPNPNPNPSPEPEPKPDQARLPEGQHGAGLLLSSAILALYRAEARSASRRLLLGRVLFAVRQLGLPPSQFDAEQLVSLEAAAAAEAEGEGETRPAAAAPAAVPSPAEEACLAAWQRELSSHAPTAAAVRAEAGALVPMLRSHGAGGGGAAVAALVRMAVGAAGWGADAAARMCTLRLLRRVLEGGGGSGLSLTLTAETAEALAALLVQLLAERLAEAASETEGDTEEEGDGEIRAGGPAIGGGGLELEALRLVVAALEADGDGGGHKGGLLHGALAAALVARARDAAACRRAMVLWLQRGVACAHALGAELSEVAASAAQLEPPDGVLLAALATDGQARVAEERDGAAEALELLRLTLLSLRLMARHAGLLAFVLGAPAPASPAAATAAPPAEPELLEPLANCVGIAVQWPRVGELRAMCAPALAVLAAAAACPPGAARRALLRSSVPAACACLLCEPESRGADDAHGLRDGAAGVLLRLCDSAYGAGPKALAKLRAALPSAALLDRLVASRDEAHDLALPSAEGVLVFALLHELHGMPAEASLDARRRRALAHHRASVIRLRVSHSSSGERRTVYLLPPAPCRRHSSAAWRKLVRELPPGPPAARLRALTRHARELIDSRPKDLFSELLDGSRLGQRAADPKGTAGAASLAQGCCTSGPPRLLRAVLSIAQQLLLLLVNGALLRGNGRNGVAGLGALLASCAVAGAALDEPLIMSGAIRSSPAAPLREPARASFAASLGLAEVLRFPPPVECLWSGATEAVRGARARPAGVFALAAVLGLLSPLVFPPLLLASALPLIGHAFAPSQPRLARALKPCALLGAVLVVLAAALRAPEGEPGAMRLLGLAAGVLLPTAAAQLLFVQIADALADQPQPALLEGSAPPEAAHREWRVLCLLVHLLGEPPSRLAGPEADALRWLLAGELDITGAGRQG